MNKFRAALFAVGAVALTGQTRVELSGQSKNVDFTAAPVTRPFKTGTVLPAACNPGDLFFDTSAAAGANIYGCVSANTWAGQGGVAGAALTVKADEVVVGTRPMINVIPGFGFGAALSDTGNQINMQYFADTAVMLTKAVAQSGSVEKCAPASASGAAYACAVVPTLTAYATGMLVSWIPDVDGAGGATTLNVDGLGAKAVKLADGTTDPSGTDIVAGRLYRLWYDGTVFRMTQAPSIPGVTQPTCAASNRGRVWFVAGATGVKDDYQVCAKDASDSYAWRVLY
jgi:hypothetical protein